MRVRVELEPNYTVRRSEQPTLAVTILGNDASIDFIPKVVANGMEDRTPIPPGSEIEGYSPVSVATLINRATDIVPTTQEALNDIRKSLKTLEEMTPLLRQTATTYQKLGDTANRELPDLARSLKSTSDAMNKDLPDLVRTLRSTSETMNKELPELTKSVKSTSDDIGAAAREYRRLGENVNVFLVANQDKFLKILDSLNLTLDRVALLLSDENLKEHHGYRQERCGESQR